MCQRLTPQQIVNFLLIYIIALKTENCFMLKSKPMTDKCGYSSNRHRLCFIILIKLVSSFIEYTCLCASFKLILLDGV